MGPAQEEPENGAVSPALAPAPEAPRVFISYSSFDRAAAFEVMRLLQDHGCDVWLDFFDIKPAEVLDRELSSGIAQADVVCLLLSPTSVASVWVAREVELARARPELRILPVILRPCRIPDTLDAIVGIDVSGGLAEEAVRLRLVQAVLGAASVDEGLLLIAGERTELAKAELRQRADEGLPEVVRELDRVRDLPIREVSVALDLASFPGDRTTILELRLELDALWTQPMSFFLARYREGATWPDGFDFAEPPHTEFAQGRRPRVDCKLSWFDRIEEPVPTLGSTDFAADELPARFTFEFDGETFQPGGAGIHLRQTYEVPSLRKLADDASRFRLVAHYPDTREAEELELGLTDVDLEVTASFAKAKAEPANLRIFDSHHSEQQKVVLSAPSLVRVGSPIEREALLALHPAAREDARRLEQRDRNASVLEAIEEDRPVGEDDRRLAARLAFGEAQLAVVRNNHLRALQLFQRAATELESVVLEGWPTYEESALMYRACANLVGFFIQRENWGRAADFVNSVGLVAQRLVELEPEEPDYQRMWADALFRNALVHGENGDTQRAAGELAESMETWRRLQEALPTRERLVDARKALATALQLARKWEIEDVLPLDAWRAELDPDGALAGALAAAAGTPAEGPAWLRPVELEQWPTVPYESPLLRYALRVPKRWSQTPTLEATATDVEHRFDGTRPSELLSVSFMEKATGGDMRQWVDAIVALAGFPVLALLDDGDPPRLLEWGYEGTFADDADRLALDELHGYCGIAKLAGNEPSLARIYILLARRRTFAWKVTLAFETATLPGMPAALVTSNDHVRAGAVLGDLRLG